MLKSAKNADEALHAADIESLEREIMELARSNTGARHGAIFLWDPGKDGLILDFHVVEDVVVTMTPTVLRARTDGQPSGIALWVFEHGKPYLCRDARDDPNYTRYFLDVLSIAAVPIVYGRQVIGVLTVASRRANALDDASVEALEQLAQSSAKFLRRAQLSRASAAEGGRPFLIKGLSPQWLEVERRLEHVAPTMAPVLIHGESGTGKELVAHAIHFNSRRSHRPFVTVNCAAIPETMLESVLFGHVKGAFTGASFDKIGEFQKADGGTLFLDEVGELPLMLQAKVLRAVEQGEVARLGSNKPPAQVDVRLLCATNRDLPAMCKNGEFRDDLYYRLSVMTLELPALRTYKDQLGVLAQVFLQEAAQRNESRARRFSPEALDVLQAHPFPGNVRELKNAIEHAVIMAQGEAIVPDDLPPAVVAMTAAPGEGSDPAADGPGDPAPLKQMRERWLEPLERRYLTELLERTDGHVADAARLAGVNTVTLYRLLKKRGLRLSKRVERR